LPKAPGPAGSAGFHMAQTKQKFQGCHGAIWNGLMATPFALASAAYFTTCVSAAVRAPKKTSGCVRVARKAACAARWPLLRSITSAAAASTTSDTTPRAPPRSIACVAYRRTASASCVKCQTSHATTALRSVHRFVAAVGTSLAARVALPVEGLPRSPYWPQWLLEAQPCGCTPRHGAAWGARDGRPPVCPEATRGSYKKPSALLRAASARLPCARLRARLFANRLHRLRRRCPTALRTVTTQLRTQNIDLR